MKKYKNEQITEITRKKQTNFTEQNKSLFRHLSS